MIPTTQKCFWCFDRCSTVLTLESTLLPRLDKMSISASIPSPHSWMTPHMARPPLWRFEVKPTLNLPAFAGCVNISRVDTHVTAEQTLPSNIVFLKSIQKNKIKDCLLFWTVVFTVITLQNQWQQKITSHTVKQVVDYSSYGLCAKKPYVLFRPLMGQIRNMNVIFSSTDI